MELRVTLPRRAYELFNLRRGEESGVLLMLLFSFFQYFSLALLFISASAIFLTDHSISELPYVYIGTSVSLVVLTLLFNQLEKVFSAPQVILAEGFLVLTLLLLFRYGFHLEIAWMGYALMIGHRVIADYIGDGYNRLAILLFDVRQSKRLYGLITSAEIPASVLGYLSATALIAHMGASELLWISAAGVMVSLVFLTLIVYRRKHYHMLVADVDGQGDGAAETAAASFTMRIFRSPLILALCATMVFSVLSLLFIEFAFLNRVAAETADQQEVVFFIAVIFGAGQAAAFFIKTFLYGFIQRRFGTKVTLFVLPFALAIVCVATLFESVVSNSTFTVVYTWVLIMLVSDILNASLYNTTFLSLLQPLRKKDKVEGYNIINNVEILVIGLAGLILLIPWSANKDDLVNYSLMLLAAVTGWIICIPLVNKRYLGTLEQVLKKRTLDSNAIGLDTPQTLNIIHQKLRSEHPGEVLYALDVLCKERTTAHDSVLASLIRHPVPEVRRDVFQRIQALKLHSLQPLVRERIVTEEIASIRQIAVHTYCSLGEATVVEEVSPLLDSPVKEVRTGAMTGLITYGGINGIILAGQRLLEYINSDDPELRAYGAHTIGEVGIHNFYHPLLNLLDDRESLVQREALKAAGRIRHQRLFGRMIRAVARPGLFESAVSNLIRCGEPVVDLIAPEFAEPAATPAYLRRLAFICGRIGGSRAIDVLRDKLHFPNVEVREQVLHSCLLAEYKPPAGDKELILKTIHAELADATWLLNCLDSLSQTQRWMEKSDLSMLSRAIQIEISHVKKRLLYLLSFLYHSNEIFMVWESLQVKNRTKVANALEILDVVVSKELSSVILPLLEDFPVAQQLKILNARYSTPRHSIDHYVGSLIGGDSGPAVNTWTRIVAVAMVSHFRVETLVHQLISVQNSTDEPVALTARRTLHQLAEDADEGGVTRTPVLQRELLIPMETKLLTIEKVMALKTTAIFRESPEDLLLEISSILREFEFGKGEVIVQKGEIGTCMYIIYSGSVRVHDGDLTLANLGNGDFFGELSLLDTEPRSASVTAGEDSVLLRIDQQAFYEIMADRVEIIREIMKILCRRLRNQNQEVAKLSEKLHASSR